MYQDYRTPEFLKPQEIKAVYEISRVIFRAHDTFKALQQIITLARPVFIFDNIALYQLREDGHLEPSYARAIGRGRSSEADLTWGEVVAKEVIRQGKIINQKEEVPGPMEDPLKDRLRFRFFLGLPLRIDETLLGALVFIRFGGPDYTEDQVDLAEFIAENVTHLLERKRLIQQIASLEAKRKLDQLQEDFIATVSHDLRSPLGFIKGYATTLLREDTSWDKMTRKEFLSIIDEEADRLGELIDNLLDSSRLQAGTLRMEFRPLRIDTLLREIIQRAKAAGYQLFIQDSANLPETCVQGDSSRLVQVFDNLFRNANKYAKNSIITLSLKVAPDKVVIIFHDTGPGIPEEYLDEIFERFYRLPVHSNAGRGSGLGLYICRQIVQAHHGKIYATSQIGKGTTFFIELPLYNNKNGDKRSEGNDSINLGCG